MKQYSYHNLFKALNPDLGWDILDREYDRLRGLYNEPHRHYHTWVHIEEGWKLLDSVRHLFKHPAEAEIAWYYHDSVYLPGDPSNEEKSAETACVTCDIMGLGNSSKAIIKDFIINSPDPNNSDLELFHDIDFNIFGQSLKRYLQYAQDIRQEYKDFPLIDRYNFLKNLKGNIFLTIPFNKFNGKAIRNIVHEKISIEEMLPYQ